MVLSSIAHLKHVYWKVLAIVDISVHGYKVLHGRLNKNRNDSLGSKPSDEWAKDTLLVYLLFDIGIVQTCVEHDD